jgi:outer membrane murein-binding lipoprotein Lpp
MTKIYSKFFCMFTITMISLGLFNAGCTNQPKRTEALDTKMNSLSQSVEGLEPQISRLKKDLDAQVAEIDTMLNSQGNAHKLLEERVSETGSLIEKIKQNLDLVEEDKDKMIAQLDEFGTRLTRLEAASRISKAETNLTEKLLDDGIKSYSQQKFEEAISKWEEVLARNPAKLEAKFFIEIAKDRIKQTQIHEELKALLIQRK